MRKKCYMEHFIFYGSLFAQVRYTDTLKWSHFKENVCIAIFFALTHTQYAYAHTDLWSLALRSVWNHHDYICSVTEPLVLIYFLMHNLGLCY